MEAELLAARKAAQEAQARAEANAAQAAQIEREKIENQQRLAKAEADKRADDTAHRAKINNEALDAMIAMAVPAAMAKEIIAAIAKGQIPNIRIFY
jgi:hypothetical protein